MPETTSPPGDPLPDPASQRRETAPHRLPERPPTSEFEVEDPWSRRAPRRRQPAPRFFWRSVGVVVASALVGAASASAVFLLRGDTAPSPSAVVERVETQIITTEFSAAPAAAVALKVLPSIVTVEIGIIDGADFIVTGSGSGVVIDVDGTLVTNEHVVGGAAAVRVVFADGRSYDAEVVGTDSLTDLAVITIDALGLTAIELGTSVDMAIGDPAIAIGSPLGLAGGPSVTVGVLSAFDRRVQVAGDVELFGMLQTDAPITRGSSGGALVDSKGRLIGITSAIGVSDVGAEGLGFAIPVEMMTRITQDILEFGGARHAFLGITGSTHFEIEIDGAVAPAGVAVASVIEDTAADAAGLLVGDIIESVDGQQVTTMNGLVVRLRFYRVGDVAKLQILRNGEIVLLDMELLERPEGV
ncbi:MAG: trypsin-like peptidase domain-containing protein [Acidobacteria bacterium]|nr:trypsin-like peptidase domain-containing protein [Acidobacteriota bacterium]